MISQTADVRAEWTRFAGEFGAELMQKGVPTSMDNFDRVVYKHRGLTLTLDYFRRNERTCTRVYAPFAYRSGFEFAIYPSNFIEEFAKWFGMQDITAGDADFDRQLIVRGADETRVKEFLANAKIRGLLVEIVKKGMFTQYFQAGEKPADVAGKADYLFFSHPGAVNDVELLKLVFRLLIESLDQLAAMGIIAPPAGSAA